MNPRVIHKCEISAFPKGLPILKILPLKKKPKQNRNSLPSARGQSARVRNGGIKSHPNPCDRCPIGSILLLVGHP